MRPVRARGSGVSTGRAAKSQALGWDGAGAGDGAESR
jgi:hypothetical protein